MRLLIVGMMNSVHAARWIRQLAETGWEIYLFSTFVAAPHPILGKLQYTLGLTPGKPGKPGFRMLSLLPFRRGRLRIEASMERSARGRPWRERWLEVAIRRVRPDIVHSMEFQHAGYLCLAARNRIGERFPTWIATNWGSDVYLYGRLPEHRVRIEEILRLADFYSAECQRDVVLARELGFRGQVFAVVPNAGGLDLDRIAALASPGPTSARKLILIKGYQHFSGRALFALEAIRMCADRLRSYAIRIFAAHADVRIATELLKQDTRLDIECIPFPVSHEEMLRLHGAARISIGLGISDGISTSFLEALAMGSFPIQSFTACAEEWVTDGVSGVIVPPGDPGLIADRIVRASEDDALVDRAAAINRRTADERLDQRKIGRAVIEAYEKAFRGRRST